MTTPATKPCDKCAGEGTVPREVRKLESGEVAPFGLRPRRMCEDYAAVTDKPRRFIADQF